MCQSICPSAIIGGVLIVTGPVSPDESGIPACAVDSCAGRSKLPAADAAGIVFPAWSGTFVTVLSLLTLFSMISAVLLGAPRILLAIGRDGLFRSARRR